MIFFNSLLLLFSSSSSFSALVDVNRRQQGNIVTTCGYINGDGTLPRTAGPGYNCRFDGINGLWGFCPNNTNAVSDCGFAGFCIDSWSCTGGCGPLSRNAMASTIACASSAYCKIEELTQTGTWVYTYVRCGPDDTTLHLQAVSTSVRPSTVTSESPSTLSSPATDGSASPAPSPTTPGPSATADIRPIPTLYVPDFGPRKSNTGPIVGGVVGGITVICISVFGILFLLRYRAGSTAQEALPNPQSKGNPDGPVTAWNERSDTEPKNCENTQGPVELPANDLPKSLAPLEAP